jgi:flagellum-specific peptidoglycan hydrolase FlgJ
MFSGKRFKDFVAFMVLNCLLAINEPALAYRAFFEDVLDQELKQVDLHDIPANYIKCIVILETGYGTGRIYKKTHNLFSIKGSKSFRGSMVSDKYGHLYYQKDTDSLREFIRLISTEDRYHLVYQQALFEDPIGFFKALQKAGYAEDKHYAEKLIKIYDSKYSN